MASFIIILLIAILSVVYVGRLVKYKFRYEKRPVWKFAHIAIFIIVFIPIIIEVLFLEFMDNAYMVEKGLLVIAVVLLYLGYKMQKLVVLLI